MDRAKHQQRKGVRQLFPFSISTCARFSPELRHIYSLEIIQNLVKCHKITLTYHLPNMYIFRGLLSPGSFSKVTKIARLCTGNVEERITFGHICIGYYTTIMAHICSDAFAFLGNWHHSLGVGKYQNLFSKEETALKIYKILGI